MPVITISREYGALGDEVGHGVAERLGLRYVDKEVVAEAAELAGIPEPELAEAYERRPTFLERFVVLGKAERYADSMNQALLRIAEDGDAVIMGRGSQMIIPATPEVFHVRITAPFEVRAHRTMDELHLDWHQAVAFIHRTDHTRALLHEVLFGIDWANPNLYDLVLNTGSISVEASIDILVSAIEAHQEKPCEERPLSHDDRVDPHEWGPFAPTTPW